MSYCFRKWSANSEKDIVAMPRVIANDGVMHAQGCMGRLIYFPLRA